MRTKHQTTGRGEDIKDIPEAAQGEDRDKPNARKIKLREK
jgi:hypothetical protein